MAGFFRRILFFSKRQKQGLVVLLIILALVVVAHIVYTFIPNRDIERTVNIEFRKSVEQFISNLKKDSSSYYKKFTPYDYNSKGFDKKQQEVRYSLFSFDPNTIDSLSLIRLGIKPHTAKIIINYRKKGGWFNTAEDLGKIYGLTQKDLDRLKPYINISQQKEAKTILYLNEKGNITEKNNKSSKTLDIVIEINSADTTELKQLQGIGSYFARQIVAYRQKLGGYYSIDQLLEIKNFTAERLKNIRDNLTIDTDKIKKIKVKWATVERLDKHPYIKFSQAKALFELNKKQSIKSVDDIKSLKEFSLKDLEQISPYLDF